MQAWASVADPSPPPISGNHKKAQTVTKRHERSKPDFHAGNAQRSAQNVAGR
jgi:hypothetical protein